MDENILGNIVGSLINNNKDGFGNSCGGWWIFLLIILFMNGGMWGANNRVFANSDYVTQAQMTSEFNSSRLDSEVRANGEKIGQVDYNNLAQTNNIMQGINKVEDTIQYGFCNTNHNIDNLKYEMAQNTCKITTNATENTQRILDKLCMMESNAKDQLIASLRSDLQAAQLTLGNGVQTQSIINALKPYPVPAYVVNQPTGTAVVS